MDQILKELQEIKNQLNVHSRMLEDLLMLFDERNQQMQTAKKDTEESLKSLFETLQQNPAIGDNPILRQMFSNFGDMKNDG